MPLTEKARENMLKYETSPYLLQHAEDPVHWRPWCQGALLEAKQEDKPIFLSIGYSTCHWCHVMGKGSFQDPEVASALNRDFIPIKVDREERPDIDGVYMAACQALTGTGGWPLTLLLTPDQEPFWAGTYLPPRGGEGRLGLLELLDEAARLWHADRPRLLDLSREVTVHIARGDGREPGGTPSAALLDRAAGDLLERFDPVHGGFGGPPKFPAPQELLFLLAYGRQAGSESARAAALLTLLRMARGGLFDQIGGGFCRYSTDREWRLPHFEKMLYDNALLAYAYLDAYTQTGEDYYREVARRTLDYVLEELRLPGGGFACAQDADSGGVEGGYYLLTRSDVEEALGVGEAGELCQRLSIGEGKSIPQLLDDPEYADFWREHGRECARLSDFRRRRARLHRDDKVLTGWNAMTIAALAKACRVLGEEKYLRAALAARLFLKTRLTSADGRLWLRWRDRESAVEGQLDDYAFYCWALAELYETTFSTSCLREALGLAERMAELFPDEAGGGFYRTAADAERLIVRQKETRDGAFPSGNAMAGLALERLARLTGQERLRELADRQLGWLAGEAERHPDAYCASLLAMMEELCPRRELVCVSAEGIPAWLAETGERERLTVLVKTPENSRGLARLSPRTEPYPIPASGLALYLCREGACAPPVRSKEELERLLREDREPVPQ